MLGETPDSTPTYFLDGSASPEHLASQFMDILLPAVTSVFHPITEPTAKLMTLQSRRPSEVAAAAAARKTSAPAATEQPPLTGFTAGGD
jgi:hypothetical protein